LARRVDALKPQAAMEIGLSGGGSFKVWEQILPIGGLLIGVDREDVVQWDWRHSDRRVVIVLGESDAATTVHDVAEVLRGGKVDWLYIDAHHEYYNVNADFNNYGPFVKSGGLIGFHDTGMDGVRRVFDRLTGEKEELRQVHGVGIFHVP